MLHLSPKVVSELQLWARTGLAPGEEDVKEGDMEVTKKGNKDGTGDKYEQQHNQEMPEDDGKRERELVRTLLQAFHGRAIQG